MRAAAIGLGLVVVLATTLGCAGPVATSAPTSTSAPAPTVETSSPPPSSAPTLSDAPTSTADRRRADLAFLIEELVRLHPNPFLDEGEAAFRARMAAIEADADALTDAGFLVAVMDLMGHRDRDGHSGAWGMAQTGDRLHAWPIWLWDFPDGLRIVAARSPYDDLVGARITAVGGTPVADAWAAVEPLTPRDNPSTLRASLPMLLTMPEVLAERDVLREGAPGLTVEMEDGTSREITPDPLPIEAFRDWVFGVYGGFPTGFPPDPTGLAVQRHRDTIVWTEPLPDGGRYIGFNQVQPTVDSNGVGMHRLATDLGEAVRASDDDPVIVDMRNNPGGNNTTSGSFRSALERYATASPGSVAVIAGRTTFSAAGNFVTELETGAARDAIHLVGEPPGGGPNIYGDVRVVTLPNSGIVVLISTRYHERRRGDDRLEVEPDIPVEMTWADLASGRDPVLEAAIEAARGDGG